MPTRQTEVAQIELLLRQQLAHIEATARPGRSPFARLAIRLAGAARTLPSLVPVPTFATRQPARAKVGNGEVSALTALFPPDDDAIPRQEPRFAEPRRETRRLPILSGKRANNGAMKQAPERDWGPPPAVQFPMQAMKKGQRSDLVIAGLGLALGLVCALFPWYIFFNPEQFGVQAISFGGRGGNAGRAMVEARPGGGGTPVADQEIPDSALDLLATGTLQVRPESADTAPGVDQQPYPAEAAKFRLVHIANGRAMIEDDAGLWVVQQGSVLPDSSVVRSIEQRNGRWVLVTSTDQVVEISK